MGMIRNVSQSAQEREIVKTSPDIVVYFNGLPYLINPFLATSENDPVSLVNFNDHVTGFNSSYAVDNWVPGATVSISVPNHLKYLYQVPGGTNLIKSMMEVQVYAKGYYLANNGNTLYRRVFKGLVSHISHQDDGKSLEISVQCMGVLQFLEKMQIELHPTIQTNSIMATTPLTTTHSNLNPYQQAAAVFLTSIYTDGFQTDTVAGASTAGGSGGTYTQETNSPYFDAIKEGYIARWQAISQSLGQDVHIYGLTEKEVNDTIIAINATTKPGLKGTQARNLQAVRNMRQGVQTESDSISNVNYDAIRKYTPEMSVAAIQLVNGNFVNRLDRLRSVVSTILFEGYQDIDGQIIIKPPMYNLDVTNLGSESSNASKKFASTPSTDINTHNNPFIINLSEIRSEHETEDQAAVRATRVVLQGTLSVKFQVDTNSSLLASAEYVDLPKLAQFGLRESPMQQRHWLQDSDHEAIFAHAVMDLTRANRGYRTYAVTIPMRPEIRLGFPCFIPHKDMYGYINNISLNYQIGGEATMTITMDTLRKRPMFPRSTENKEGTNNERIVYTTQPNLVHKWTTFLTPKEAAPNTTLATSRVQNVDGSLIGQASSITKDAKDTTSDDDIKVINYRQSALGLHMSPHPDTKTSNWNIQEDSDKVFSNPRIVDSSYYHALQDPGTLPFTDGKGYEVVAPFPWGRYTDLKTALWEFTQEGYIIASAEDNESSQIIKGTDVFLFAGLETPSSSGSTAASDLTNTLNSIKSGSASPNNKTIIELSYENSLTQKPQPDNIQKLDTQLIQKTDSSEKAKISVFLSGSPSASKTSVQDALALKNIPTLTETGESL
jgi:hypothetical protein